jgi:hypothetical protein
MRKILKKFPATFEAPSPDELAALHAGSIVKSRTRLFEVKLPFPITVEHYAWFEDYPSAERDLHCGYHA